MKQLVKKVAFVAVGLFLINAVAGPEAIRADQSDFLTVTGPCNLVFPKA